MSSAWDSFSVMFASPDFGGDGKNDVIGGETGGAHFRFDGNGLGGFYPGQPIGTGWDGMRSVFGPGDFSGDRRSDVMAVNPAGELVLYRGNGLGGWSGNGLGGWPGSGLKIGTGWTVYR